MWYFLVMLIVFEAAADVFAKKYGDSGTRLSFNVAIMFYVFANVSWLHSMRSGMKLWVGSVIFSIMSAVLGTLIGVLMGETISMKQQLGIFVGLLALVLIQD